MFHYQIDKTWLFAPVIYPLNLLMFISSEKGGKMCMEFFWIYDICDTKAKKLAGL
jgi:hypothetical protein